MRWSEEILDETERALNRIYIEHGRDGSDALAATQVKRMQSAFPDAMVEGYEKSKLDSEGLPDREDVHVVAAARRCRASVLVTENVKHFPPNVLDTFGVEVKTSDDFIADTIDLDPLLTVDALARIRISLQTRFYFVTNPEDSSKRPIYFVHMFSNSDRSRIRYRLYHRARSGRIALP